MKPNKYRAVKTKIGDVMFHSKREAEAWVYLKHREKAGEITDLRRQVKFELKADSPNGPVRVCNLIVDFVYVENGEEIIADAKGVRTPVFNLKAKMFKANYGREIQLI